MQKEMNEMIETVARAICAADGWNPDGVAALNDNMTLVAVPNWWRYEKQARAAITAMRGNEKRPLTD